MKYMDQLPSVTTCCFCSYLRAGCILIALISFLAGLLIAPNVSYLSWSGGSVEQGIQITMGVMSVILCICSCLLFVGAFCNVPVWIEIYQWGAIVYGFIMSLAYLILAYFCFFVYSNSVMVGVWMMGLIFVNIVLTIYFVIVANSFRMSVLFLYSTDVIYTK